MERYPTPNTEESAGLFDTRFEAMFIDGLIIVTIAAILGYTGGLLSGRGRFGGIAGLYIAVQFGTPIGLLAYQTALEGYYGQTIGKHLRGIVVVKKDGSSITWGASVARNLLRLVDMLPILYIIGIVVATITADDQRLGDLAGDTVVVQTQD